MKASKLLLISILLINLFAGCKQTPVEVSSVSLNTATVEMVEGDTYNLVATVLPTNAEYEGVNWASSNTSVVSVNNGTITALKEGKSTVTVSAGGKSATCSVSVSAKFIAVTSITLDKVELSLQVGCSDVLTATVKPENATDKSVQWASSDASIVKVENGKVTALKSGTAIITATAGSLSAECVVTSSVDTESISLDKTELSLAVGETATIVATITPVDATDQNVTWASSDPDVASVDKGNVKALKAGTAIISAECSGKKAECVVTIIVPVSGVTLDITELSMAIGETVTLTATVTPADASDKTVSWSTSDNNVVTVSNGVVTAIGSGTATISAKAADKAAMCVISVADPQGNLIVFKDNLVKKACVAKFDKDNDGWVSYEEASAVTDLSGLFDNYNQIKSFDELQYFNNVKELPRGLFSSCATLTTVTIPQSVENIGSYCFSGCLKLNNIEIPQSVKSIGDYCFNSCAALQNIVLPEGLTSIGQYCFSGCRSLSELIIPESITILPAYFIKDCSSLISFTIPESVKTLGDYSFADSYIQELTIPNTVTSVSGSFLNANRNIQKIVFEATVRSIPKYCFNYCTSLSNIVIRSAVTEFGGFCFNNCSSLTSIIIPSSVTKLGKSCFSSCTSLTSIVIPSSVTKLEENCFAGCKSLSSIDIPSSVTFLGEGCFSGCSSLTSITIPPLVTELGKSCIAGCSSLTSIVIPSSVTKLGDYCFANCSSLSNIEIPSSVIKLGFSCFQDCVSLASIDIPSSVTTIDGFCFLRCTKLSKMHCYAISVPSVGREAFTNTLVSSGYLYVPEESIDLYKNDSQWGLWKHILKLE